MVEEKFRIISCIFFFTFLLKFHGIYASKNVTSRMYCDGVPCEVRSSRYSYALFKIQENNFKSNLYGVLFGASEGTGESEGTEEAPVKKKSWTDSISKVADTAQGAMTKMNGMVNTAGQIAQSVGTVIDSVGGIIKTIDDIKVNRQKMKMEQKQFEAEMATKTTALCQEICVLGWQPWSRCTAACGGGRKKRERVRYDAGVCAGYPCPHHLTEEVDCNLDCPNDGWPLGNGKCNCKRNFKGDCCDEEILCDYAGKPRFGDVYGEWPTQFGGVCTYDCNDGFALVGTEYRICREGNIWSDDIPKCERTTCSKPSAREDSLLLNIQDEYYYQEKAYYRCDRGYDLAGSESITCESTGEIQGRFSGYPPLCLPKDCGPPNWPFNGGYNGMEFTITNQVKYYCDTGFRLSGSPLRECLKSGDWSGVDTECKLIQCEPPFLPKHGDYQRKKDIFNFGDTIRYECEEGHIMVGELYSKCVEDPSAGSFGPGGQWNSLPPECTAAICKDPGEIENGLKDGSNFFYPYNVTYYCDAGHFMKGHQVITCKETGVWSYVKPSCNACEVGYYKSDMKDQFAECSACPMHSSTSSTGSTSIEQCICDEGFHGTPGGACSEIACKELSAPENGTISDCGNSFENVCYFDCDDGYFMRKGSAKRECKEDGFWDGFNSVCEACRENTYKADFSSCFPCPKYSHAGGIGNVLTDCKCDEGFEGPPGGPCNDRDECKSNGGKGPCSDVCENKLGGFTCSCTIPGQTIKDNDPYTCVVDESCRNLTLADAPANGGMICHWFHEESSQQCDMMCNPGYDFPSAQNDFENCGPTTDYDWGFEIREEPISDCEESFFPEIRLEGDSKYFTQACKDISEDEKSMVKEEFAKKLNEAGVCLQGEMKICEVKNMDIICGESTFYNLFNGQSYAIDDVNLQFNISAIKLVEDSINCEQVCERLKIPHRTCNTSCVSMYKKFLRASVEYSKKQIEGVFQQSQKMQFAVDKRNFYPVPKTLKTSDVIVECKTGMVNVDNICVGCSKGTYYDEKLKECKKCRKGFYQPQERATKCEICPSGFITLKEGSSKCEKCPNKRWGLLCRQKCEVVNGECHPETGETICSSGYEGPRCTKDIDGCIENQCSRGTRCVDIKAPGTGYRCV